MRKEMFDMMMLRSSAFEDTQTMPPKYAKKGENVSPPLSWDNVPQGTKSFALAVVDRHPVARNFVHWLVIDMSADVTSLEEGASGSARMPAGSRELKVYGVPIRHPVRTITNLVFTP
jgi:Raf kinase inhibitor-like YbhB/YbcL family protein